MKICAHAWYSKNSPSCCMKIVVFFIWLVRLFVSFFIIFFLLFFRHFESVFLPIFSIFFFCSFNVRAYFLIGILIVVHLLTCFVFNALSYFANNHHMSDIFPLKLNYLRKYEWEHIVVSMKTERVRNSLPWIFRGIMCIFQIDIVVA